jgi:putative intracellular protease/amidase
VVAVGGSGAKKYLWPDRILKLMLTDRHRGGFVVAAIGMAVPCLGELLDGRRATADINKDTDPVLKECKAVLVDEDVVSDDNVVTARGAAAEKFALAVVDAVEKTRQK